MDRETIREDIYTLCDELLTSSLDIIEYHTDFIQKHSLIEPKKNYFLLLNFLLSTINNFTNLDDSFTTSTLIKLHKDIQTLHKLYGVHQEYLSSAESIFDTNVSKKIILFQDMKEEIIQIQSQNLLDDYDQKSILTIKDHYKQMKKIYFAEFQEDFMSQNMAILSSLRSILNSKLYYFDKLIWIQANKSPIITRLFKNMPQLKEINSQAYLEYRLQIDLPYSDEYKYLTQCLRIYK